MLFSEGSITAKLLEEWVLPDGSTKHRVSIDRLVQLRIFTESVERLVLLAIYMWFLVTYMNPCRISS
ncbi:unnamed protein product [Linum tenue]|uniref:Uncharacterized protein n=1 Tax=Linum tenue TaxID=586396 RepID=A0AAV0JEK8_9ROSI|nr:unnamed protein product [Linum tenue]